MLRNNVIKGVILVGLGATSYGMLATFVKMAYADLRYPNGFAVRKPVNTEAKLIAPKPIPATPAPIVPARANKA